MPQPRTLILAPGHFQEGLWPRSSWPPCSAARRGRQTSSSMRPPSWPSSPNYSAAPRPSPSGRTPSLVPRTVDGPPSTRPPPPGRDASCDGRFPSRHVDAGDRRRRDEGRIYHRRRRAGLQPRHSHGGTGASGRVSDGQAAQKAAAEQGARRVGRRAVCGIRGSRIRGGGAADQG